MASFAGKAVQGVRPAHIAKALLRDNSKLAQCVVLGIAHLLFQLGAVVVCIDQLSGNVGPVLAQIIHLDFDTLDNAFDFAKAALFGLRLRFLYHRFSVFAVTNTPTTAAWAVINLQRF